MELDAAAARHEPIRPPHGRRVDMSRIRRSIVDVARVPEVLRIAAALRDGLLTGSVDFR